MFYKRKSYNIVVDSVKELLFISDCAINFSLYNPVNFFANLLKTIFIVTRASFYIFYTSSHQLLVYTLAKNLQNEINLLFYSIYNQFTG